MCGIIGVISKQNVVSILIQGLKRLEYRGYDSAGIVVIDKNNQFNRVRITGKVINLEDAIKNTPIEGKIGLAHTRWATHGKPSEINAHPHIAGNELAIVHNGIIENHQEIRKYLLEQRCHIESETDSELVAHLIDMEIKSGKDLISAVRSSLKKISGSYAIGLIFTKQPDRLIAFKQGSPLVIGLTNDAMYICSDALTLLPLTNQIIYLEDGDIADIRLDTISIFDHEGNSISRETQSISQAESSTSKEGFPHYMLKEIFEQPNALIRTLQNRIENYRITDTAFGDNSLSVFKKVERVHIIACGTSYHAGLVARTWIEEFANIPCQVEIASEFRYKHKITEPNTLFVTLSQSGETADTLAALNIAKSLPYLSTLTICNVDNSSLVRNSHLVYLLHAGPEVGVASTKSFTCQLAALYLLSIMLGRNKSTNPATEEKLIKQLSIVPQKIQEVLYINNEIKTIAENIYKYPNAIYIARGNAYPIAMEGALKLKEISYIHAEAYPAGELKHGPLALINNEMPVIVILPNDDLINKTKSNMEEIVARNGLLYVFADKNISLDGIAYTSFLQLPASNELISPFINSVAMQLLAYQVAYLRGADIDQPRNLAKSVTVE